MNKDKNDMNNSPVLIANNLTKSYRQYDGSILPILGGFSLELNPGEMVALIGPSGSGKSTLLHGLGLLDSLDSGDLTICGENMMHVSDAKRTIMRRHHVGFVYQFHHLLPEFSALENIIIPQIIAGVDKKSATKRANDLLDMMKLSHRATHRPSTLSGGEQQRVAIARALANSPSLLLADEPTGNLDPETSDHVFHLFIDVVRETKTAALIATHNMDLANKMDRTVTITS